jgi:16S rRNA (uracil1498-N3)-methyltransferase
MPDTSFAPGQLLTIDGREAFHAVTVKRLRTGEAVELLDGAGTIASATVEHLHSDRSRSAPSLAVRIDSVRKEPPLAPAITLWSAAPKGDRIEQMIDQLAQVGAAAWGLLSTSRGIVEPREHKLERLDRIAAESAKQSGRAHFLTLHPATPPRTPADFAGPNVIVADASGDHPSILFPTSAAPPAALELLVGPEGGFTEDELAKLRAAGCRVARFGPHTMRIETAAPVAVAILLSALRPDR